MGVWRTGCVPESLSTLRASSAGLPSGPLAFVCRTGNRGARAAARAILAGRSAVHNVVGGLDAWEAAGLPVTRPEI
ncbi:rhodanese-like domain-containing protein [Streptomyces sp. NPDC058308]|uniref:rhodanese-like domain-containing protein n=1 Tax=Streptomyces sp. NPDC058308 TaxID=3346440 RepID=UPI0036E5E970